MRYLKPCLVCGTPSYGSRCPEHERNRQRLRNARRPWYRGPWKQQSKAAIAASPVCANCGTTGTPDNPLTGDHVKPRSTEQGIMVLCRRCNAAKGAKK